MTIAGLLAAAALATGSVPGAGPSLRSLDADAVRSAFVPDPDHRVAPGQAVPPLPIVNAFEIMLPPGRRLIAAGGLGFLPMEVRLDKGGCYLINSDYVGRAFVNGSIQPSDCTIVDHQPAPGTAEPPRPGLRLVHSEWGFQVWRDAQTGAGLVTARGRTVLALTMDLVGVGALGSPHGESVEFSFVGLIGGRPTMVTAFLFP